MACIPSARRGLGPHRRRGAINEECRQGVTAGRAARQRACTVEVAGVLLGLVRCIWCDPDTRIVLVRPKPMASKLGATHGDPVGIAGHSAAARSKGRRQERLHDVQGGPVFSLRNLMENAGGAMGNLYRRPSCGCVQTLAHNGAGGGLRPISAGRRL